MDNKQKEIKKIKKRMEEINKARLKLSDRLLEINVELSCATKEYEILLIKLEKLKGE